MAKDWHTAWHLRQMAQWRQEKRVDEDGIEGEQGNLCCKERQKYLERLAIGLVQVKQLRQRTAKEADAYHVAQRHVSDGGHRGLFRYRLEVGVSPRATAITEPLLEDIHDQ